MLNELELTGRTRTHVEQLDHPRFAAQREAAQAFLAMRDDAKKDGFDLLPFSTFRDFDMQLRIWNSKFTGKKPLYDIHGEARDFDTLSEPEIIDCILNWSALPGGSRHHWGTEIDVVDGAAMPAGYRPLLLPEETQPGGLFHPLHQWLDANIATYGFFRPYNEYRGGMYPEPWHLSYAPLSVPALGQMSEAVLARVIEGAEIHGKAAVLQRLPEILRKHVLNIVKPDEQKAVCSSGTPR